MAPAVDIKKIALIGCGSMGGGMALLFAENGIDVEMSDIDTDAMDKLVEEGKRLTTPGKISRHDDYESMCGSFGDSIKVFLWSLPHGNVGDKVLENLLPFLRKGDIVIDAGNEHWQNTERRQGKCAVRGIRYVGMGVSGGYQAARRGPSMCPGSDDETLDIVLPTLRKVAAKDTKGRACVGKAGTGGAGNYCKMIHNGIEHGMMSSIAEAFSIMHQGLNMSLDEIGKELDRWNEQGELKGTFLVAIGADMCRIQDEHGASVLEQVEDKVVQDFTGEEGTGIWSNTEAVEQHVPSPTLSTAHFFRLASGDRHQRAAILAAFSGEKAHLDTTKHSCLIRPRELLDVGDKKAFLEDLRKATFVSCLLAYCQGMNIISKANKTYHFNVNYPEILQIWKGGCIIQADYISEEVLEPVYGHLKVDPTEEINPLYEEVVAKPIKANIPSLKKVVLKAIEADLVVPSLSASLEYVKYQTSTDLQPASFYEAQLDYFGAHMYDKKGEDKIGAPEEGKEHFEWKPA